VLIERLRPSGASNICTYDSLNFARGTTVLRPQVFLSAAGLSAVAAITSVAIAWPEAIAQSMVTITAKQASLRGVPVTARPVREQNVSRLIVKMRASGSSDLVQPLMATHVRSLSGKAGFGVKSIRPMSGDASVVVLDAPLPLSEAKALAARLASDPAVEYAEPDVMLRPLATPNDANFMTRQWNLFPPSASYSGTVVVPMGQPAVPNVVAPATGGANLPNAWEVTTGAATVVIAIIDTGIVNHPDLNDAGLATLNTYVPGPGGRFLPGYDFVSADTVPNAGQFFSANDGDARDNNPADPGDAVNAGEKQAFPECEFVGGNINTNTPSSWHGTHSAGIAAGTTNNTAGIAGIGWNVKVLPVRALGKCGGAVSDIADAIRWAAGLTVTGVPANPTANVAKVISIGAGTASGTACSPALQTAIDAAIGAGSVVIAAAGNDGEFAMSSPANCVGVVSVTAHVINGENANYSNIGPVGGTGAALPTISAAGGGSPASLGALGPIDNPNWDGFYIWSTTPSGGGAPTAPLIYAGIIGTSAAAAQVAGVAALIKSKAANATPAMISSALTTSVQPFPDVSSCAPGRVWAGRCGAGMLDATRALQAAGAPVVVTAPRAVTVAAGATASFTVEAIGVVGYQWTRAGANIAGATGPSYTTPALAATDNNVAFAVVLTNLFGTTTSSATVTVNSGASNSPSGGGALPFWQLLLLSALLLAGRVRVAHSKQ